MYMMVQDFQGNEKPPREQELTGIKSRVALRRKKFYTR